MPIRVPPPSELAKRGAHGVNPRFPLQTEGAQSARARRVWQWWRGRPRRGRPRRGRPRRGRPGRGRQRRLERRLTRVARASPAVQELARTERRRGARRAWTHDTEAEPRPRQLEQRFQPSEQLRPLGPFLCPLGGGARALRRRGPQATRGLHVVDEPIAPDDHVLMHAPIAGLLQRERSRHPIAV
jgi:hypothetical protein